jgi:hypothetical protein
MGALNCKITKGVVETCSPNVSGVLRMAIANWDESYANSWISSTGGDCMIDSMSLVGDEKAYNFAIMDGTGQATSTGTIGANADSRYHQHSVTGQIAKLDCDLLGDYNNFFLSKVIIFVETKNREVFAFGVDNGLRASTWTYDTGAGEGDANGINFVFEGSQPNPPLKIASWDVVKELMN